MSCFALPMKYNELVEGYVEVASSHAVTSCKTHEIGS